MLNQYNVNKEIDYVTPILSNETITLNLMQIKLIEKALNSRIKQYNFTFLNTCEITFDVINTI